MDHLETIRDQFALLSDTAVLVLHLDGSPALWVERSQWVDGSRFGWTRWTLSDDNDSIEIDPCEDFSDAVAEWKRATA